MRPPGFSNLANTLAVFEFIVGFNAVVRFQQVAQKITIKIVVNVFNFFSLNLHRLKVGIHTLTFPKRSTLQIFFSMTFGATH